MNAQIRDVRIIRREVFGGHHYFLDQMSLNSLRRELGSVEPTACSLYVSFDIAHDFLSALRVSICSEVVQILARGIESTEIYDDQSGLLLWSA